MNKKMLTLSLAVLVLCATAIARVPSGDEANMTFSSVSSGAKLELYDGGQTKINVPETHGGADVTTIGATAFTDPAIEMIYLPITTTTVEENAFLNCGDNVIVILELSDPLADVPKDVAKWGMGDYTAEIRHFTDTGRTDLFIVKGEIEPEEIGDCSNLKAGRMSDLIAESNLNPGASYTGITYTKDKEPPEDAYDISLGRYECSRGEDKCVQMWAEGSEIYITFCGDKLYMHPDVSNYYTTYCGFHPVGIRVLGGLTHISGLGYIDTSAVTDMSEMFCQHGNLDAKVTRLDLSSFDTSNVVSMSYMFGTNTALTDLDISNFDTSSVTNMNNMFYKVSSLKNLDLSHFDTSNVTSMRSMFQEASSLTSLNLSSFNTSKVMDMSYMFRNTEGLTSLDVSNFDTSNVTNISGMFYGTSGLTSLDVSNFDTSNITDMSYMFYGSQGLKLLDVSNFDTSNVTNMSYMFRNTEGLTSLDVSNFDTSNVTNMSAMFNYTTGLTSLDLRNFDTSNVTNMNSMFSYSSNLTSLDLSSFDTSAVTNPNAMFLNASNLTDIYARTEDDKTTFTTSSGFPTGVTVTVVTP